MATLRYLISNIRSRHRLLTSDNVITDRAIAAEIKSATVLLLKRETNLRRLWATSTIFTTIPCLEMMNVPISECVDFHEECEISRSKYKLPSIPEGLYQYLIQGVYSINALGGKGKKLKEVNANRYINILKLPYVKKEEYYWIVNNYLYVSQPNVKSVRISAMFEEDVPDEIMYPKGCCGDSVITKKELCKNPLDREFSLPSYLETQVLSMTSENLLKTYHVLRNDNAQEGLDEQVAGSSK